MFLIFLFDINNDFDGETFVICFTKCEVSSSMNVNCYSVLCS